MPRPASRANPRIKRGVLEPETVKGGLALVPAPVPAAIDPLGELVVPPKLS
jgi:hypothetical protein